MSGKFFFRQVVRNLNRTVLNCFLVIFVTAFFVVSLNLYANSVKNLEYADDTYSTIAIMELYGSVDPYGNLADPATTEFHRGYISVAVEGYDLSEIVTASGVIDYDLREKSAVYIAGEPAYYPQSTFIVRHDLRYDDDIIRFTLHGNQPVTIPIGHGFQSDAETLFLIYLDISDHAAADLYSYANIDFSCREIWVSGDEEAGKDAFAEQIRQLNRSDETDTVTLYPGVEYIAWINTHAALRLPDEEHEERTAIQPVFDASTSMTYFFEDFRIGYTRDGNEYFTMYGFPYTEEAPFFPIMRWEDVQADPELTAQWEAAWETIAYNTCSYTACFTDDITGVPVFHLGGAALAAGRMITDEEYESGARVCMVSKELAELQGWKVGDRLEMHFYQFDALPNASGPSSGFIQPIYSKDTEGFYDEGTFEIVGIYTKRDIPGNSGISATTMALGTELIYIPHNAVQSPKTEEELPVHGALLTIWLENGSIDAFLADMDALGLTEQQEGRYNPSFTFYDQGYSVIQPSLQNMYSTARLLLLLSAALLICTCVLLAWFFAQGQKHSVGIFRMLGGKRWQALLSVLLCAVLIAALGAAPGAAIGHALSTRVGESLLTGDLEENGRTAALRAYVLATETDTTEFTVEANARLSALAGTAALLFPLLVLVIVIGYIGREPRALLPMRNT